MLVISDDDHSHTLLEFKFQNCGLSWFHNGAYKLQNITITCSSNIFAHGFPHRGRGLKQRAAWTENFLEDCIIYASPINTAALPHEKNTAHSALKLP